MRRAHFFMPFSLSLSVCCTCHEHVKHLLFGVFHSMFAIYLLSTLSLIISLYYIFLPYIEVPMFFFKDLFTELFTAYSSHQNNCKLFHFNLVYFPPSGVIAGKSPEQTSGTSKMGCQSGTADGRGDSVNPYIPTQAPEWPLQYQIDSPFYLCLMSALVIYKLRKEYGHA